MSFDDIVKQNIVRRNMQMGVTPSVADTTTDNVEDPLENQQARYGLFPYGNQYGFTKLNQLIDEDGLDSQQRFELQQQWFKNQENYIKQLPPEEQVEWNKTLDEIKSSDTVLKPYSTLGAKAESVGTGVARMQAGVDEVGARVLSHLDKTDSALEKEIANEHQDAYDKYKKAQTKLDQLYSSSLDNPTLLMEREKLEDYLSEDERSSLAWFDNLLAKKRADTVYSDDANFLVKDALAARDVNIARANKKSQYGGAEERRDAIRGAGKDQGFFGAVADTAKAAINDPNAALDVAFESTGANLIPQLVGIAAGAITRSPMVYQVISSVGQAPSEIQSAFQETLQEKYQDKYGKSDLSKITPDELETIITENAKEFSDSFTDGVRNAAIIAAAEPLAAKGVGQVAKGFTKLSSNAKSTTLKALGISGATAAKLTGEGWEEAFGQIATNLVDGKPWDEGVGNSFVMALIGLENVPNTVAVSKDVKNQLAEELGKQPTTSAKPDSTPPTNDPQPVNESEDSSTTTETVTATTEEQPQLNAETENELYTAYRQLIEQRYNDELSEDEFRSAIGAIHAQFDKEIVDQSTGEITIINTFDPAKVYQIGQQNENRSDYSNGGEDDNGSSIQSSIDELDGGRTQSSSNTSEQVSGNETEASSTGDSQSNSEFVENITEQQDDNPQESSATGLDGRTNQTDGSRVDQGEFGELGSEQVEQPAETTQFNGEDGRVQQRTEINSNGETLANPTDEELEETSQRLFGRSVVDLPTHTEHQIVIDTAKRLKAIKNRNNEREEITKTTPGNITDLSNTRLRANIQSLSAKLRNANSYVATGGKNSKELASDLSRLRSLIDESAKRQGKQSKADEILSRIQNETTYTKAKKNAKQAMVDSIHKKLDAIEATLQAGVEKTSEAISAVKSQLSDLLDDIRVYLATFSGRVRNNVKRDKTQGETKPKDNLDYNFLGNNTKPKDRRSAEEKADDFANELLSHIEDLAEEIQPKIKDTLRKYDVWRSEFDKNVNELKQAIDESLHIGASFEQKEATLDDLLNEFTAQLVTTPKGFIVSPDNMRNVVAEINENPELVKDKALVNEIKRVVINSNYPERSGVYSNTYGNYAVKASEVKQVLDEDGIKQFILESTPRKREKKRWDKAEDTYSINENDVAEIMLSGEPAKINALTDLVLANELNLDHNTLLNWLVAINDEHNIAKINTSGFVDLAIDEAKTNTNQKKKLAKEIENATSIAQLDAISNLSQAKILKRVREKLNLRKAEIERKIKTDLDVLKQSSEVKQDEPKQTEQKQTEEQNQPLNETSNMANPLSRQIEQENNKLHKMNVAMEDTTNPYRKKFVGADLRNNQKEVNKLLQDNPQDMALIREAFFNATPNATEGSFQVAQRGYVRYSPHNPQHKAYKGNKQNLLGFDFDGNPVLKNQAELFSELFDDLSVENQTTLVLAQQPETTQQIMNASVRTFFKNSENKPFETEMREAVEVYATEKDILEEDGTKLEGTNENLTIFANNKDFLAWVGDRLRPLFEQLNKIIAGVVAVVTVGAMTIPTDAMAQQGFSAYTQGEVVQGVSQDASNTINWVKQHRDHNGKNFVIADKDAGKIHIVSPEGKVLSTQNALFGKGRGNDKSPMNTPSGRMQLQKETKLNSTEKSIYGDSVLDLVDPTTKAKVRQTNGGIVAMHRVLNKAERKSALNTAQASDNYLSHGCINIPTAFYNTAVDSLDGAMVYVLDHKKPKQSKTTTQPTKTNGVNSLLNYKPTKLFSVSAFKSKQTLDNGMTKDGASRHLQKALGNLADNVILVSREDYTVPNQGAERLIANGVEGFYHAESGAVVILADSIKAQDGLTAEERLAWVGWHELYHRGFDVKFGENLENVLNKAKDNAFIHQLAMAIKDDRINNNLTALTDEKAVEEALAELGAALATDKVEALSSRYGVSVPNAFTQNDTFFSKLWDNLKQLVRKVTGKNVVTDRQVQAILDSAITSIKPDKAERQLAEEILNAYADPNNPLTLAAKFSIGSRLKQVGDALRNNQVVDNIVDLFSTNDTHTTGHNPNSSQTRATKVMRKRSIGLLGNIIEGIQDSRYRIDRLDEQGEGGKLSRAVANMSNRTQQKIRTMSKGINDLTREMMNFADTHRDIFPKLSDKKQVDVVVNEVITALRTLTGGNEVIRKNLQEALGGKDFFDQDGNLIHHQKGLLERRQDLREMEFNRATLGIPSSPFITSEIARLTREIDDHLAIQQKFDESNNIIIKENKDKNSRKHWHGHNGYTMAEAHALLQQKVKDGLIDNDVLVGVTPRRYDVKQYTGNVDQEGNLEYVMVSHFSYDAKEVEKNFTGEIKPLVDQYEKLSADMHQFTVKELGKKLAGNGTTAKWETSTMGKVKEIYSTNLTDENGNPIVDTFVIENPNSIDEIVTLQKAAEYTGHRTGRAFSGGSALEQLTWRVQLTAQQSSAQEVGAEMYAMYERGGEDTVRVYHIGDKDYTLQKGIVIEVPERDSKGRLKYNADGTTKTKLVKVAFKDQEANAALFGDNIKGNNNIRDLSTAGLLWRLVPITVSRLAKFAAQNLTMSPTFGITNAYKGLKEKQNQVLAWGKNSTWVKSLPEDKQRLFDGVSGNNKLYTMFVSHLIQNAPKTLSAYEPASLAFAWKLATKQDLHNTNLKGEAKRAYDKLVAIYERGGISSKVEDLFVSTYNKKLQFALGGKANKQLDKAMGVLEKLSVATMSQELVSTLLMTDFLQNELGMEAQMAYDANLHFMNFDKRGASSIANYLRNYTMFANAIAQGSRAYLRGYTEMDRNGKLHLSKQGAIRLSRNIAIGAITHSLAMVIGEMACPEKAGSLNQVGDLNPYQLMREIPIATGCGSFIRFPIEYGVGMTENMFGVAMLQVAKGFWSVEQAGDAILDTIKDNAVPMNMPIGEADSFFGSVVMNLVYPVTPEPARDWLLAFGGVDAFGNQINSKWAGSREYKPAAGKQTTDKAWFEKAEWLYEKGFNVTPEEARAIVTGPFQGVTRQLLTWFIEKDPRVAPYDAILGTKSLWRSAKDEATVAYTVVMNNLNGRYSDLHNLYIKAHGIDKTDPTDSWLEKNNISLSADDRKVLGFITKYRTQMKNTKLSQDQRYKYNMEFLKNLKTVTHPEG